MGERLLDLGYQLRRFFRAARTDLGSNLHLAVLEVESLNRQPARQPLESFDNISLVGSVDSVDKALGIADDGQEKVLPRNAPPEKAPATTKIVTMTTATAASNRCSAPSASPTPMHKKR